MKLIIGADMVPTESTREAFETGRVEELTDEPLRELLSEADYRIFNLECPLMDEKSPIAKCGPNLRGSVASIMGMKKLWVDFFTLANNHIMDHGKQGLLSTIQVLQEARIAYSGVGNNLAEAQRPYIATVGDMRVGIYCCAEHEFSIATEDKMGANPFDVLDSFEHIASLRTQCDYLVCLYHGGKEYYRYPSPYLQRVCRKIVEKGADLVVCQHSHCIGCKEDYKGGIIVYGQGNFLFDKPKCNEFWRTSLLLSVDIEAKEVTYIPLIKHKNGMHLAQGKYATAILGEFQQRSQEIQTPGFVKSQYAKFAKDMVPNYIARNNWLYTSLPFRAINKLTANHLRVWIGKRKIRKYRASILNHYECEAHRELIIEGLKE